MTTETDENYLKEIYTLQLDHDQVTTSMLANRLGTTAATVTGMLKKISERKWVTYEPYKGVVLTHEGKEIALKVIRNHRLIEAFLSLTLGVPWDKVHKEAERLEHAMSEELCDRIDEYLGYPETDPHGSPIPAHDGSIHESGRLRLADLPGGARAEIVEVWDRDPKLLEHLDKLNLRPKTKLEIIDQEAIDGLMTVRVMNKNVVIGQNTASQIFVKRL